MSMLPPVFRTLMNSADFQNFVVTGSRPPRIYRHGQAPQDVAKQGPYATWQVVSGVPENNLSDVPDIDRQTVQVDCWHPDDKGIELMGKAARDAIEPVAHMTQVVADFQDSETRLYRWGAQFDFIWNR